MKKYILLFSLLVVTFSCFDDEDFTIPKISKETLVENSISCLFAGFEEYEANSNQFNNFINHVSVGSKLWTVQKFISNSYLESSAYGINKKIVHQILIPIDFNKADEFSFSTKDGYFNGNPLRVYYTNKFQINDYKYDQILDTKNTNIFTDITIGFNISKDNTEGYAKKFLNSGNYTFPKSKELIDTGFIILEYNNEPLNGKDYVTTTIQIDDIKIIDNENLECL